MTRTAHFGGLFFALSNLHIKRMIRLSISPMPQAACVGKTTVHVVNPLFAVHCDIVQTTESEGKSPAFFAMDNLESEDLV